MISDSGCETQTQIVLKKFNWLFIESMWVVLMISTVNPVPSSFEFEWIGLFWSMLYVIRVARILQAKDCSSLVTAPEAR